jgi:hypothetical protein
MPHNSRCVRRLLAALVMVSLCPSLASAQERRTSSSLKLPTIVASAAAAADWATTYHALKNYHVREQNPFLSPFQDSPATVVSLGSVMDVGLVSAWNLTVGRKSTKAAAAGLWAMAAFRAYLAIHNIRNTQRAVRR